MQGNADLYRYSISAQSSEAITAVSAQGKMMYSDSLIYIMDNDNIEALAYTDTSSVANLQRSSITPPNTYRYSGFSASTTINILNAALYDPTTATNFNRVTDYKLYELKDHLGNVRVVISDIKEPTDANFNQFTADLQSYYNYYPFGMLQPKRHYTLAEEYKFGFGGQMRDDEIAGEGNSYTADFWQYDSRLGRRWNIDPVDKPYESSYACFGNTPIWAIDPSGADSIFYDTDGNEMVMYRSYCEGTYYFGLDKNGEHTKYGSNFRQGMSYHSLFGDEQLEAPTRYSGLVSMPGVLSEMSFYNATVEASHLKHAPPYAARSLFWANSGPFGLYDFKNKGAIKSVGNNESILVTTPSGGIVINRNEAGMFYWGYAAAYAYQGDKFAAYKMLASDNKWMHQSIEGGTDEWGEVYAWTFGYFLSKNGGEYYPQLKNDVEWGMLHYYNGNVHYRTQIYDYGAKQDIPQKGNYWERAVENLKRVMKVAF